MNKKEFTEEATNFIENSLKLNLVRLMMNTSREFEGKGLKECKEFADDNFSLEKVEQIWNFVSGEKGKKGTYVSRAVYQMQVEENRKLLRDIYILVEGGYKSKEVEKRWRDKFNSDKEFTNLLREMAGLYNSQNNG